jgi:hypothetical protein
MRECAISAEYSRLAIDQYVEKINRYLDVAGLEHKASPN